MRRGRIHDLGFIAGKGGQCIDRITNTRALIKGEAGMMVSEVLLDLRRDDCKLTRNANNDTKVIVYFEVMFEVVHKDV